MRQKYFYFLLFCIFFTSINIVEAQFNVNLTVNQPRCGGFSTGNITATASGGASPYYYRWNTGAISSFIDNLPSGIYTVTVTDALNKQVIKSATITAPPELISSIERSSCATPTNLTAVATGGTGNYTYRWNTGSFSPTITNASQGEYCVTIFDENTCGDVTCIALTNSSFSVNIVDVGSECSAGNQSGKAQVNVTGGSTPYTYLWSNGARTQTISNIPEGNYSVTVTDGGGCTATDTQFISTNGGNGSGFTLTINTVQPGCNDNNNGRISVITNGGIGPFSYRWNTGQITNTISDLSPGTYTVTVTAANGCTQVASRTINNQSNLSVTLSVSNESCAGLMDGSATVFVSNGQPPYSYLWSTGDTSPTISNLTPGSYRVTVSDAQGCSLTRIATINASQPINVTITGTNTTVCADDSDGILRANVQGGTTPIAFRWSNGANTATISNLGAGTYTVTVTDVRGCMAADSLEVISVPNLEFMINTTGVVCEGTSNGAAIVAVTSGTAPFTYRWSNGQTTATATGFDVGTASVTVTDNNGCSEVGSVDFTQSEGFTINTEVKDILCSNDANGSIEITIPDGMPPFTIQVNNGFIQNTVAINQTVVVRNLIANNYDITVTDVNDCQQVSTVIVSQPDALVVETDATEASCGGFNNGTATAFAEGGFPPYSYAWSDGQMTMTATGLTPGNYLVTVTDNNNCQNVATAVVLTPAPIQVNITGSNQACDGSNSGQLTAVPTTGDAPFTYRWSTGATSPTINNLSAGTYCITITDAGGCTGSSCQVINAGVPPIITFQGARVICPGFYNGSVTAIVTGNTDPYTYLWSTGAVSPTITNIGAGSYSVTVTGTGGCSSSATFELQEAPEVNVTITSIIDASSTGAPNGSATAQGQDGFPPYTYLWNDGQTTATATGLAAGTYMVTVSDMNGCQVSTNITIGTRINNFDINAVVQNITCFGDDDGSISVTAENGQSPYTFAFSNGFTQTENSPNSGAVVSNLSAGTYSLTVTDANGLRSFANYTIEEPTELMITIQVTDETFGNSSNGTIRSMVTGGTLPYTYLWSTGATTPDITNLASGNYTLTVTDANGCSKMITGTVNPDTGISVVITNNTPSCPDRPTGTATATVFDGVAPFNFIWTDGQTTATAINLPIGLTSVTVTDSDGRIAIANVDIMEDPNCMLNDLIVTITTTPTCPGQATGTGTANVSNGTEPYMYLWQDGQTSQTGSGFSAGNINVVVTDANGAMGTASAVVEEDTDPDNCSGVTLTVGITTTPSCTNLATGTARALPANGVAPYTYRWNNGVTTQTARNFAAGDIASVTVTDANNSTGVISAQIDFDDSDPACPETDFMVDLELDPACFGMLNGSASADPQNGRSPYTYSWANGDMTQSSDGYMARAQVMVTVTDADGIMAILTDTIPGDPSCSTLNVTLDAELNCPDNETGVATATINNGRRPYSYEWKVNNQARPNENGSSITVTGSGSSAGTQVMVTVTDLDGVMGTAMDTFESCFDDDNSTELVRLFPNPATDMLHVQVLEGLGNEIQIELLNLQGALIKRERMEVEQRMAHLNLSNIPGGIYFIKVTHYDNGVHQGDQLLKVLKH